MAEVQVAYCVKCKQKRDMKDPQQITMKHGKPAMQGTCEVCGIRILRILPKQIA